MRNFKIIIVCLFSFSSNISIGASDYTKDLDSSEMSEWFFGPSHDPAERRVAAINIGRVGVNFKPTLSCGKLSFKGSLSGSLMNLQNQVSNLASQMKNFIVQQGALSVICYMQPNICSHIRHFSAVLQRELKFQFNACQSIDDNINSSTSRHQKQLIAESVARCLKGKSARQREDAAVVNQCRKKAKARSRNILKPFQDSFASGEQQVLKSLLTVIDKSENYDVLSKLFGETKISINGHYKPLFPADLLKPEDYSHNVEVSAHEVSCDLNALSTLINTRRPSSAPIYSRHLNKVIKRKITKSVIFDLESLPISDQKRACSALGDALAELALKDFSAEGRSDVSAALTNDALPEDLRIFYEKRSATTFSSIEKRIQAKEVASLKETKLMIHRLAKEYRKINRREASGITARKNINKSQKDECIDQLSCEGGIN